VTAPRRSPWLATRLLDALLPEESRDVVIGDLIEAYHARAETHPLDARRRFWREAIAAIVSLQIAPDAVSSFTPYTEETVVQSFFGDIRHAIRVLSRARGFTALCVLTLGVAIGATTAVFSIVNPVLLRPLPYPQPDRIVTVYERDRSGSSSLTGFATFTDLKQSSSTVQHMAALGGWEPTLFGDRDSERLTGLRVSADYFRALGVRPAVGRDLQATDDTPDNNNVVILSYGIWQRRFGGDSSIIGKTLNLSGVSRTVIGVMPESFENVLDPQTQIYRALGYSAAQSWACRTCRHLRVIGRLAPGVTRERAAQEMNTLATGLAAMHPKDYAAPGATVFGLQERATRSVRPILLAILGAVVLVLLVAAANVANLQLARAVRRNEEFAVRAALGAGRRRLAQQLLAEGLVLAALGGAIGIALAYLIVPALALRLPESLPRLAEVRVDWRALVTVGVIVLGVGLGAGLLPAMHTGRLQLFDALRGSGRSLGSAHHRARAGLVIGEIALALMLVVGATLLGRSLTRLLAVDVGFNASHLLTMDVHATGRAYETPGSVFANHDRIREAVSRIPGVVGVALATQLPLGGNVDRYGVKAQDKPLDNPELSPSADRYTVTTDFLRTMGIPIRRGRDFNDADGRDTTSHVVIVSEALVKRIWGTEDPIGKRIHMGEASRPWRTVIGVVADIRHTSLDETVSQQVYIPERQWWVEESAMMLVVRVTGDPSEMATAVRRAVRDVDPLQPVGRIATMDQLISRSTAQRRLGLLLFAFFGGVALLLASGGIYGVLAGAVSERTREFGLRSALGATPGSIAQLVMWQGARLTTAGLLLGGLGAIAVSRGLRALLFGIAPMDPLAITMAAVVIICVAVGACVVPTRRAVRVDPMTALRAE
jgi:putative ABC transport system permease protein